MEDRFSFSPTKSSSPSDAPSKPVSKPTGAVAKPTAKKVGETKKRRRVLDESDDEFVPGAEKDDDHAIVGADSDNDDASMSIDLDDDDEDDASTSKKTKGRAPPAIKKAKRSSASSSLEKDETGADSSASYFDRDEVTPSRKSYVGKSIDEKLEAAQNDLDKDRIAAFSERVVVAVDRAFERMARYGREGQETGGGDDDEGDEEEEEEESNSGKKTSAKKSSTKSGKAGGIKYTTLEQQYLDIRKDYPDSVLFVETGYRYKFFGKDAEIAAKVLNIRVGMSHNFLSTSVPVHRLHVHALRLVQAGYKVGVVSQTETAALKAISTNKSGPFKRAVSALYTKSTLVSEHMDPLLAHDSESGSGGSGSGSGSSGSAGSFLFSLYESPCLDQSSPDAIRISIVAVNTSTGDIVYDEFDDAALRSSLETRLKHISPIEIILPATVSLSTKKLIETLYASRGKDDQVRIEYREANNFDTKLAREVINDELTNFANMLKNSESGEQSEKMEVSTTEGSSKSASKSASSTSSASVSNTPLQSAIPQAQGTSGQQLLEKAKNFFGSLSNPLKITFGALGHYLKDFGLSSLICLTCNFNSFTSAKHMYLDGNALSNLELLTSSQNTKSGSLFGVLDQTSTPFGRRRLMQWIRQPLLRKSDIEERLDAVEEISRIGPSEADPAVYEDKKLSKHTSLPHLLQLLPQLPDMERGITRIFYSRCSVAEFLSVLVSFRHIESRLPKSDQIDAYCSSSLLRNLFRKIPDLAPHISYFLDPLNIESTDKQKRDLFLDDSHFPELQEAKEDLKRVEGLLDDHLDEIRSKLGKPNLEYVTKNKDEYIIELTKAEGGKAPKNWITLPRCPQSVSRFHTPYIIEKYAELCQCRERLAIETANAWSSFVAEFASRYPVFRDAVDTLAQLDVLQSFAKAAKTEGFVRPTILDVEEDKNDSNTEGALSPSVSGAPRIDIKNGRHPVVEQLLAGTDKPFVPNDTKMGEVEVSKEKSIFAGGTSSADPAIANGGSRAHASSSDIVNGASKSHGGLGKEESSPDTHKVTIITGPNMGGKTCYTRQVATLCIMAQMGCYVAADEMALTPLDLIATRMGAYDQMFSNQSTFFVELQETSDILKSATPRSLVILDELGRGTSTHDGFAIAYATLHHLLTHNRCFVLFVTHYPALAQLSRQFPNIVSTAHISYLEEEVTTSDHNAHNPEYISRPRITFLHKLVSGVEDRSFGMNVARLANLPAGVVDTASGKSTSLETQVKKKYARLAVKKLYDLASKKEVDPSALQSLVHLIGMHS